MHILAFELWEGKKSVTASYFVLDVLALICASTGNDNTILFFSLANNDIFAPLSLDQAHRQPRKSQKPNH